MAYTPFDATKPDGSTQAGSAFSTSTNANDKALRDAIIMGAMSGFVFSQSSSSTGAPTTTVDQPAYWFWKNGTTWLRATLTWGAGAGTNGNPTNIVWDLSINGTDYTTAPGGNIGTQTFSWDSTTGALTATTGFGATESWVLGLLGKYKVFKAAYDVHAASSTAHSAGTMSTQAASAVAITGGSVSCTYEREASNSLGVTITGSTAINWTLGGYFTGTITGAGGTFTHTSLPSGVVGYVTLLITNPGVATTLLAGVKWSGGAAPAFTVSGKDIVTLLCADGATVYGSHLKDVR